jgi:hypothetical protein
LVGVDRAEEQRHGRVDRCPVRAGRAERLIAGTQFRLGRDRNQADQEDQDHGPAADKPNFST